MCTVTYIPLKNGALLSSNRDEDPGRKRALPPAVYHNSKTNILYPADGLAGGTWIALNDKGDFIILLNGGLVNHTLKNKYRISRGIIVKEMIAAINLIDFWNAINLEEIEPFTLILYSENKLHHLVWNGDEKFHSIPDASQPHIWSSVTLYDADARQAREKVFRDYLKENAIISKIQLLEFLRSSMASDSHNGFVMNRNNTVRTCSISVAELCEDYACFDYCDLLSGTSHSVEIVANKSKKLTAKPTPIFDGGINT